MVCFSKRILPITPHVYAWASSTKAAFKWVWYTGASNISLYFLSSKHSGLPRCTWPVQIAQLLLHPWVTNWTGELQTVHIQQAPAFACPLGRVVETRWQRSRQPSCLPLLTHQAFRGTTERLQRSRTCHVLLEDKPGPEKPVQLLWFWPDQYFRLQQYIFN